MDGTTRAKIEDLYKVEGKAALAHGEIVEMPPAGGARASCWRKRQDLCLHPVILHHDPSSLQSRPLPIPASFEYPEATMVIGR